MTSERSDPVDEAGWQRICDLLDQAAGFFERCLWESTSAGAARDYLSARGLGREICERYRVGFSPAGADGFLSMARKDGCSESDLGDAGFLLGSGEKARDRFQDRLMFPLADTNGRAVAFAGRALAGESPKYLNSPEGPLYTKGRTLYGLFYAASSIEEAGEAVVVEGYPDALALAQAGLTNVVASMGTALNEEQIRLLGQHASDLVFVSPGERAGREAAVRSAALARILRLAPFVAKLLEGEDAVGLAVRGGRRALDLVMEERIPMLDGEL